MAKYVSDRTKQCKHRKNLFGFLHFLCLFGPFLYFIPYGYMIGEVTQKVSMSFTIILSVVLAAISFIVDVKHRAGLHRSIMWALIAGVLFCLKEVEVFIWIMAVCSLIDEMIFTRLRDYYKSALISNKEIDRRGVK